MSVSVIFGSSLYDIAGLETDGISNREEILCFDVAFSFFKSQRESVFPVFCVFSKLCAAVSAVECVDFKGAIFPGLFKFTCLYSAVWTFGHSNRVVYYVLNI